jgi:hypothetical protein
MRLRIATERGTVRALAEFRKQLLRRYVGAAFDSAERSRLLEKVCSVERQLCATPAAGPQDLLTKVDIVEELMDLPLGDEPDDAGRLTLSIINDIRRLFASDSTTAP